jgi:hypothetical protein
MKKDNTEKRFYVYGHFTENGDIFYIGVGTSSGRQSNKPKMLYPRAYHFKNRTKFWKNVRNKYGIVVKILSIHHTKEESLKEEKRLISKYGRRCKDKNGCLTNLSEGGEIGPIGFTFVMKQEQKDLLSELKSRTFYVYSKEGEFLKTIKGEKRTAEFCGVTRTAVTYCFNTKHYTNGHFVFKEYMGETLNYTYRDLDFTPYGTVKVSSESPDGIITKHNSITDCAKFLNRDRKSVEGAIKRSGTCNKHKIKLI